MRALRDTLAGDAGSASYSNGHQGSKRPMTTDTTDIAVLNEQQAITRADPEQAAGALQHILATGDLAKLTNQQRVAYYLQRCQSLGLNPLSRPFDWLILDGKLVLYDNKSCAEQLRRIHQISVRVSRFDVVGNETKEPMVVCSVEGRRPNGQTDEATKYVPLMGWNSKQQQAYRLSGKELANAYAKAETGAKRRLTFSMIGMAAPPDTDELERALPVVVDGSGKIIEQPNDRQKALAADPRLARAIGEPTFEDAPIPATGWAPLADSPDQRPTMDELTPAKREVERQSFRPTDEQVKRWLGAWFAAVKDSPFDNEEARAEFVWEWTRGMPLSLQTDSLRVLFSRSTDRQAGDILASIRARVDAVKQGASAPSTEALEDVRAAAILTGAPGASTANEQVIRPDAEATYTRAQWVEMYIGWAGRMRALDVTFRAEDIDKLGDAQLRTKTLELVGQVEATEALLAQADDEAPAF
jgi:hypothetical protein